MKWVLTGGDDGFIRKYDFFASMNGKLHMAGLQTQAHSDAIHYGGVLLSAWDNAEQPPSPVFDPKISAVHALDVHSDGVWCVTGLDRGCINLWSVRHNEGSCQHVFDYHRSLVSVIKITPDQKHLMSASSDKSIVLWDLNTGQIPRQYTGATSQIASIQMQADVMVLIATIDGALLIYDVRTLAPVKKLISPDSPPWTQCACWGIDGNRVYSGRRNGSVDEWHVGKEERIRRLHLPSNSGPVSSVLAIPGSKHLLCASQDNVRLWDLNHPVFWFYPYYHTG
ncbi:hypothetical protein SeLEV6574_g04042 [Synchytrium endobioticum]|nr:hypothetical protein SeLEV6574_g04042 [Synchytrium endobioticum]